MEEVKSKLRQLKPFIGKKADRIWVRYTTADKFESRKWEQMVNLLAEKYKINPIEEEIVLPPPDEITAKGDIKIGRTSYFNQPPHEFGINSYELTRHVGIFGSTSAIMSGLPNRTDSSVYAASACSAEVQALIETGISARRSIASENSSAAAVTIRQSGILFSVLSYLRPRDAGNGGKGVRSIQGLKVPFLAGFCGNT